MHVYYRLEDFKAVKNPVVTIGTFDGVHVGHRVVIRQLQQEAKNIGGETVLFTFHPHPRAVLYPDDNDLRLLNTLEEKISLLQQTGIEHLIVHPFTKDFSRLPSWNFVRDILVNKLHVKQLIIGYNHHFGKNREGSYDDLQEYASVYSFEVRQVTAHTLNDINISSTKIRKALHTGDIATANEYLNYNYFFTGKVVHGNHIGSSIGFPTANIEVNDSNKLIPAQGAYAVKVLHEDKQYTGMLNIGICPTLDGKENKIEVHIFDFDKNIYEQNITVSFIAKIRNERKFDTVKELKEQLVKDKANVLKNSN